MAKKSTTHTIKQKKYGPEIGNPFYKQTENMAQKLVSHTIKQKKICSSNWKSIL